MSIDRGVFVLLVLALFIFALPGCVSNPGVPDRTMNGKESILSTQTPTISPEIATPTKPTVLTERRFWTKIEPIPDVRFGEDANITINGTTNLPSGEMIFVEFFARSMHPSPMVYYPELHFGIWTEIRGGLEGVNTWSVEVPTHNFKKPDIYSVGVTDQRGFSISGGRTINVTSLI